MIPAPFYMERYNQTSHFFINQQRCLHDQPHAHPTRGARRLPAGRIRRPHGVVVTEEVFDSLDGYVTIFHEFVHCYQFETCEPALKSQLAIAQKAQAENNHMWEINAPFPYGNEGFIDAYTRLEQALAQRDLPAVIETRTILHDLLAPMEYEYMLWQEWKEGFARWLENRMQSALNLSLNHRGGHEPFTRVSFYARGAGLVALLAENDPALVNDLERLFHQLDGLGQ